MRLVCAKVERVAQTPKVCFLGYRNHGIYASLNSICLICSRSHHSMSMSNIFMGYWAMDLKHAHIASSPPPFPHLAFAMSCHVLSTCLSSERNRKNAKWPSLKLNSARSFITFISYMAGMPGPTRWTKGRCKRAVRGIEAHTLLPLIFPI